MSIQPDDQDANGVALSYSADAAYILNNINIAPQDPYAIEAWNAASFIGASAGSINNESVFDKCSWPRLADQQEPAVLLPLEVQAPYWADNLDVSQFDPSPPTSACRGTDNGQNALSPPLTDNTKHGDAVRNDNATTAANRFPTPRRRLRRQNHACDPCRTSKKACDLDPGVTIRNGRAATRCTSCTDREIDCTASWLSSRQQLLRTTRAATGTEAPCIVAHTPKRTGPGIDENVSNLMSNSMSSSLGSVPSLEADLSRAMTTRSACSQLFNIYIDIADTFLSQCVLRGSMPLQYKLGVAAYDNLSRHSLLATHFERVRQWVASCWQGSASGEEMQPLSPGPYMLRVVSLLDAFFVTSAPGSARDAALTATFKWVAIAIAAQVNMHDDDDDYAGQPSRSDEARGRQHDVALVCWQNAKRVIFANIAARHSFRLALSLALFGNMAPPTRSSMSQHMQEDAEDMEFAFCDGIRRLKALCSHARDAILTRKDATPKPGRTGFVATDHLQDMPDEICNCILELLGALEWLIDIYNNVAIGTSRGRMRAIAPDGEVERGDLEQRALSLLSSSSLDIVIEVDEDDDLSRSLSPQELEAPLLQRASEGGLSYTDFWRSHMYNDDDALFQAGRLSMAISALAWKFLARFTLSVDAAKAMRQQQKRLYDAVRCDYSAMTALIAQWRTTFGTIDSSVKRCLQISHRNVWRIFAFCAIDTDLSILLFYDTTRTLERSLQQMPPEAAAELINTLQSTRAYRASQRLVSARQIACISSTCQNEEGSDRPRNQPTYRRYMCAHPSPWMMVQSHSLAAQVFSEAIKDSMNVTPPDANQVLQLTADLTTCLHGLRVVQESLHNSPLVTTS